MPLDIAHWLEAVSAEQPAGPNLEFSLEFAELERAAQGKPEQQLGTLLRPAEEPNWREVEQLAADLLERSRDLRIAWHLAMARLHLGGIEGFAEALALIRSLLETSWDSVHPQLDPEDDNDPTLRANVLGQLGKSGALLRTIRDLPLASAQRIAKITWRDIAVTRGDLPLEPDRQVFSEREIRATFQETDQARLAATKAAFAAADAHASSIPVVFEARAGTGTGPDLDPLLDLLRSVRRDLDRFAADSAPPPDAAPAVAATAAATVAAAPAAAPVVSAASLGAITNRTDAIRLLDLVVQYYERYEPSSPLPLLIDRARRLADKNFLDILQDLAPDGLRQAQTVAGTPPNELGNE